MRMWLGLVVLIMVGTPLWAARPVYLVFEAEAVQGVTGKAFVVQKKIEDPAGKTSGNKVLAIPRQGQPDDHIRPVADKVVYNIRVPKSGTYYLWVRARWSSMYENKVDLRIQGYDKGDPIWILGNDATCQALHWVSLNEPGSDDVLRPFKLTAGVTAITVIAREGGIMLDQFLLTTDKFRNPAGALTDTSGALVQPRTARHVLKSKRRRSTVPTRRHRLKPPIVSGQAPADRLKRVQTR